MSRSETREVKEVMMRPPSYARATQVPEAAATVAADHRREMPVGGTTEVDLIGANVGVRPTRLGAAARSLLAAGVVLGMLLDDWQRTQLLPAHQGHIVAGIVLLAAALAVLLTVHADGRHFSGASPDEWVLHVGLDAIGVSVILRVAIGRRWRFAGAGRP
jgi:hypothetical protein